MKIGFIGLGIMGAGMAANIQKEYRELFLWNRSRDKAKPLVSGTDAKLMNTPADVAAEVDILITMLTTPQVVEDIATGEKGFLPAMRKGSLWVDCTTVNPSFSERMAEAAGKCGVRFVDAPVAGSKTPAREGKLLILAGGEEKDVNEARPLFNLMGRKTVHVGPVSYGSRMKMVINLMLGVSMAAFAETVYLGRSLDLPEELILDTLFDSPVIPPIIKMKDGNFRDGVFNPEFPLEWMHKDLHLASVSAYENNALLPMGNIAKDLFGVSNKSGRGREDFSAVYTVFDEM